MTGTAKTEEVEFEKTYKLETTIVPTNRVRVARTWLIRSTKPKRPNGVLWPRRRRRFTAMGGRFRWEPPALKRASC